MNLGFRKHRTFSLEFELFFELLLLSSVRIRILEILGFLAVAVCLGFYSLSHVEEEWEGTLPKAVIRFDLATRGNTFETNLINNVQTRSKQFLIAEDGFGRATNDVFQSDGQKGSSCRIQNIYDRLSFAIFVDAVLLVHANFFTESIALHMGYQQRR